MYAIRSYYVRREYDVNLITIKRTLKAPDGTDGPDMIIGVPRPDTKIEKNDIMILMGSRKSIERLVKE